MSKNKVEYEQEKISYIINHTYLPDFKIITKTGKIIYIEAKGGGRAWTYEVRNKMLCVRDQNPSLDIRLVFYSDATFGNKRKDGSKKKQSQWAIENGFKFAIKDIPIEWINE